MSRADEEGSGHVTVDQIYQAALEIGINTDRQIDRWIEIVFNTLLLVFEWTSLLSTDK